MLKRTLYASLIAFGLLGVACGDDAADRTDPEGDASLPTSYMHVDETFGPSTASLATLDDAAQLVVAAEVADIESLGVRGADEDPNPSEWVSVTLRPEDAVSGSAPDEVVIVWEAFGTDGRGVRVSEIVQNGLPVPRLGDRMLLFLEPEDRSPSFGGVPTHRIVSLSGVAYLDGDTVSRTVDGAGAVLDGLSVSEVREAVAE